ncbi:MAG TPA: DUF4203 domain-containing protein [Vicinamibacterales bacterium]|jgi:uncharacterized protein DUF4203|nr:DUF4203 domain-containing protein [Vicinamibacterales bacterium]
MLPASYQLPAAIVLIAGGVVACFFGYRLFRVVLAIFGFVLGAMFASSLFGASDTSVMVGAAVLGGLAGAGLLIAAYFVGVALVGAGLGVLVAHLAWSAFGTEPGFVPIVLCSVIGAVISMQLQRYVIIIGTAFGGSMTLIDGVMAALGNRAAAAAAVTGDIWVFYPTNPAPGQRWVMYAWLILGAIGMATQLGWTGVEKGGLVRRRRRKKAVAEA